MGSTATVFPIFLSLDELVIHAQYLEAFGESMFDEPSVNVSSFVLEVSSVLGTTSIHVVDR